MSSRGHSEIHFTLDLERPEHTLELFTHFVEVDFKRFAEPIIRSSWPDDNEEQHARRVSTDIATAKDNVRDLLNSLVVFLQEEQEEGPAKKTTSRLYLGYADDTACGFDWFISGRFASPEDSTDEASFIPYEQQIIARFKDWWYEHIYIEVGGRRVKTVCVRPDAFSGLQNEEDEE